jgi:hypothetical protein
LEAEPLTRRTAHVSDVAQPVDARKARRRRSWIVAFALPGFVALIAFALMAWLQSSHLDPPEALLLVTLPIGVISMLCWGLGPFFFIADVIMFFRDPWRRQRPRHERVWLKVVVFGSPIAWFLSNLISDAYHLLR